MTTYHFGIIKTKDYSMSEIDLHMPVAYQCDINAGHVQSTP